MIVVPLTVWVLSGITDAVNASADVGDTIEVETDSPGMRLTPIGSNKDCRVEEGGVIRALAVRDDYVLVQYIREGDPSRCAACPLGIKAVITEDDFNAAKNAVMTDRKIAEKKNRLREAEKLFR